MPLHSLRAALVSITLILLLTSGGCRYPKDMDNSLETIRDGTLHVGVTENPPRVIRGNNGAHGLEPELIKDLAAQLDADIQWHWGTESELIEALEQYQIHIGAGGFTQAAHLKRRVALSRPYFTTEYRVGFPAESTLPNDLKNVRVGAHRLAGLNKPLESKGAYPRLVAQLHNQNLPIATAKWRLKAYKLLIGPWVLSTDKHVLALPKGENAWMMKVQQYLNKRHPVEERLAAMELEALQ